MRGTDTDLLIILLGMLGKHQEEQTPTEYGRILFDCGQGNAQRYIDVTSMHMHFENVYEGFSRALVGLHALTGTDYTAAFYRKGKKMPFNLLVRAEDNLWLQEFAAMSNRNKEVDRAAIESFICSLYSSPSGGTTDINKLRRDKLYKLAGKTKNNSFPKINKVNCSMLPPCRKCLMKKIDRAVMIARIWGNANLAQPAEGLNPEDYGWEIVNGAYRPVWYDGPPLPESFHEEEDNEDTEEEYNDHLHDVEEAEWSYSSGEEYGRVRIG